MHALDIVFIIVTVIFFGLGVWRGIVSEIFRIAGLVAAFGAAVLFHRQLAAQFSFFSAAANIKAGIAFSLIFIIVLLTVLLIGWGTRKAVQFAALGWADRLIGGILGVAKAIVLAWLFYAVLSFVPSHKIHASVDSSRLFRFFRACPVPLPKLGAAGKPLDKLIDPKVMKSFKEAGKKIDELGRKVDSIKTREE
jgi:membrane protein required for colicin V production